MITNKNSNIIEDLEVIRLLHQVVIQQCQQGALDEKTVMKKAFDLILSFDDVITHGHRESVTMSQIEAYLEMDSTDEKMHKKMQLIREAEAKEISKKHQKEIAKRKFDPVYKESGANVKSISSSDYQMNTSENTSVAALNSSSVKPAGSSVTVKTAASSWMEETTTTTKAAPGKGMQLGKPKKQNELMKDL